MISNFYSQASTCYDFILVEITKINKLVPYRKKIYYTPYYYSMKPIKFPVLFLYCILFHYNLCLAFAQQEACSMQSSQSKSIMAVLLQDYDKASNPSGSVIDVQAEVRHLS